MLPVRLLLAVFGATFGCSFLFGYNIGVLNNINDEIRAHYIYELKCFDSLSLNTSVSNDTQQFNQKWATLLTLYTSVWIVTGCIFALLSGILARRLGRRLTLLLTAIPLLPGAIAGLLCVWVARCWWLLVLLFAHRLLVGAANGISLAVVPLYISELAPRRARGVISSCMQISLGSGIFFAQLLTTELVFGRSITEEDARSGRLPSWRWQWALASNAVPLLISWPILFFSVESPRFLFLERGDENAARKALVRIRSTKAEVEAEMQEMAVERGPQGPTEIPNRILHTSDANGEATTSTNGQSDCEKIKILELEASRAPEVDVSTRTSAVARSTPAATSQMGIVQLFGKSFLMATLLSIGLQIAQQFSGINAIMYYSSDMFESAKVPSGLIQYAVTATGLAIIISSLFGTFLLARIGRRPLLIYPTALTALSMLGAFVTILLIRSYNVEALWLPFLAISFIMSYIVFFSPSLGCLATLIPPELYRQEARNSGLALAAGMQWASNLVVSITFPHLQLLIGPYALLIFVCVLIGFIVFFFVWLPETRGKTFDEVATQLAIGGSRKKKSEQRASPPLPLHSELETKNTPLTELAAQPAYMQDMNDLESSKFI